MEQELVEEHDEAWLVGDGEERSGEELLETDDETGEEIEGGNLVVESSLETAVVRAELGSGYCEEASFSRQREFGSNRNENRK